MARKLAYDHYGLDVYETDDGCEYAVGSDAEADDACKEYIEQTAWAFQASFIASHAPGWVTESIVEAVRGERCEDANDDILAMIEAGGGLADFVADAIRSDGRGHFLASNDGEEVDSDSIEGLPPGLVAFRIN